MNGRKAENRSNYLKLLDLLNEYPEFFNEEEEGCPEHIAAEIKQLGQLLFEEDTELMLSGLSVEEFEELKEEGHSDNYIAGLLGVSLKTLSNWKNRNNLNRKRREPIDVSRVIYLFKTGMSQTEIAKQFDSSQPYISRLLKKEGVTR